MVQRKAALNVDLRGDPVAADYLLEEWPESLPYMAHTSNPTIPVFVVSAVAAHPQASRGVRCSQTGAESAASRDNIRIGFSTVTIGGKLYIR